MLAYYPYSNKDPDPGTDTVLKKQHNVPASFQVAIFPRFSQSKNISSFLSRFFTYWIRNQEVSHTAF